MCGSWFLAGVSWQNSRLFQFSFTRFRCIHVILSVLLINVHFPKSDKSSILITLPSTTTHPLNSSNHVATTENQNKGEGASLNPTPLPRFHSFLNLFVHFLIQMALFVASSSILPSLAFQAARASPRIIQAVSHCSLPSVQKRNLGIVDIVVQGTIGMFALQFSL